MTLEFTEIYCIWHQGTGKESKKKDQMGFINFLKICASEDTVSRIKRQHTEWEKKFRNRISDKGLISRIYKELLKLNNNK